MDTSPKVGPVGDRVRRNVKALREERRLTVRDLAHLLSDGEERPIDASGISKVEAAYRRVDVDDLVALAVALGVSPNRLLLEPEADDEPLALTPRTTTTRRGAWQWARGEPTGPAALGATVDLSFGFESVNAPDKPHGTPTTPENLERLALAAAPVVQAMADVEAQGQVTVDEMVEYLGLWNVMRRFEPKRAATKRTKRAR